MSPDVYHAYAVLHPLRTSLPFAAFAGRTKAGVSVAQNPTSSHGSGAIKQGPLIINWLTLSQYRASLNRITALHDDQDR